MFEIEQAKVMTYLSVIDYQSGERASLDTNMH